MTRHGGGFLQRGMKKEDSRRQECLRLIIKDFSSEDSSETEDEILRLYKHLRYS